MALTTLQAFYQWRHLFFLYFRFVNDVPIALALLSHIAMCAHLTLAARSGEHTYWRRVHLSQMAHGARDCILLGREI